MKAPLSFLFSVWLSAFLPGMAFACSCIGESTVKQELKQKDAVVKGTILTRETVTLVDSFTLGLQQADSTPNMHYLYETVFTRYQLLVETRYKGKFSSDTLWIYTGMGRGDCGWQFTIGQQYIIYGMKQKARSTTYNEIQWPEDKNIIWTNICTRTCLAHTAEIKEIEKYRKGK